MLQTCHPLRFTPRIPPLFPGPWAALLSPVLSIEYLLKYCKFFKKKGCLVDKDSEIILNPTWLEKCLFYLHIYFLKYLCIYLAAPGLLCGIQALSCSMWDLVPWAGIEPGLPALGAQSLNRWTTREVPFPSYLIDKFGWILNYRFKIFFFPSEIETIISVLQCFDKKSYTYNTLILLLVTPPSLSLSLDASRTAVYNRNIMWAIHVT